MRVLSLNVASLSATSKARLFFPWAVAQDADVICIQSTVCRPVQFPAYARPHGYQLFAHHSDQGTGHGGVGIYSRVGGEIVALDGCSHDECQGRHMEVRLPSGVIICCTYIRSGGSPKTNPMWQRHLACIASRMAELRRDRCIVTGDFNLALEAIDLYKPVSQYGFRKEQRALYRDLLVRDGWTDSFRHFHPKRVHYSRWSGKAAPCYPNDGWRIDYQFVSLPALGALANADIYQSPTWNSRFSDHAATVADYSFPSS